jgi:acylphosphatase
VHERIGEIEAAERRPACSVASHANLRTGPALNPSDTMLEMRVARRYVVSGRVQGVGFRYFTQDTARREGLAGVVRNLPDGRVEAVAEGDSEALGRFEVALRRGPARARVDSVDIDSIPPSATHSGFHVE